MGRAIRYVAAWMLGLAVMFSASLGIIALCQRAALGDNAIMLITVSSAVAIGVFVIWLLAPKPN